MSPIPQIAKLTDQEAEHAKKHMMALPSQLSPALRYGYLASSWASISSANAAFESLDRLAALIGRGANVWKGELTLPVIASLWLRH